MSNCLDHSWLQGFQSLEVVLSRWSQLGRDRVVQSGYQRFPEYLWTQVVSSQLIIPRIDALTSS